MYEDIERIPRCQADICLYTEHSTQGQDHLIHNESVEFIGDIQEEASQIRQKVVSLSVFTRNRGVRSRLQCWSSGQDLSCTGGQRLF